MKKPIGVAAYTVTTALGTGLKITYQQLKKEKTGLIYNNFPGVNLATYIGRVKDLEIKPVIEKLALYDCRNNRLAQLGLQQDEFVEKVDQAKMAYGKQRVAVIVGTSTSGIEQTEQAYQNRDNDGNFPGEYHYSTTQNMYAVSEFVAKFLDVTGPCYTVSTACSSSAKVFASAARLMQSGLVDAVVVGGVDSLCASTLYGFDALELLSKDLCKPFDIDRCGLNIGEAAGFALLENDSISNTNLWLLGFGESSDAYHMSSPHPNGLGAQLAMQQALQSANLLPSDIDYINLHGTATKLNDQMESIAVEAVFGKKMLASSTKGWTGHTLGAAGIVEAVMCGLCLTHQFLPKNLHLNQIDPAITCDILTEARHTSFSHVLSNSFGFGGNNCALIFGYA